MFTSKKVLEFVLKKTVECLVGTQCPRYRGCLPAIFYASESHLTAGHSTVKMICLLLCLLN